MQRVTADDIVKMGLGAMFIAKEKVESLVDEAMKQGDISKEQGEVFLQNLKNQVETKSQDIDKTIKAEIHTQLKELGLATKEDMASLRREITALKHEIQNKQS